MPQAPHTVELDEHLKVVVNALHQTVNRGMSHVNEPKIVNKAIHDCKEILDEVMEGKISEWLK